MSPVASGVIAEKPRIGEASASPQRPGPMPGKQAKPAARAADSVLAAAPPASAKSTVPQPAPPSAKPVPPTTPAQVSALQATYGNAAMARAAVGGEISTPPARAPAIAATPVLAADSMAASAGVAPPVALPPAAEKTPAISPGGPAPPLAATVPAVVPTPAAARAATTPEATLSAPAAPAPAASAPAKSAVSPYAVFTATSKAGAAEAKPRAPELPATGKAPATAKAEVTVSRAGADGKGQARGEESAEKASRPPAREAIAPVVHAIRQRAAGARKHSPAGVPVASAQAAAVVPATEQKRTAAVQTVANLDAAKTEKVKRDDFKSKLKEAIKKATPQPKTESEADKVMKTGAKDASSALHGQLATERDAAAGPLKSAASTDVEPSSQPKPDKADLVPEQMGPAPAPVAATPAVPAPLPPEQLDYSSDRAPTDQAMAESGVTKEQLEKGNEPEFKQTLSARADAEKHEAAVEGRYRKGEASVLGQAEHAAHAQIAGGLAGMHGARAAQIGKVVAQQHATKSKHAAEHQRITETINGIKNKTQADVEEILRSMESDAQQIFEAGLTRAEKAYEDTFEEEKGGTWTWLTTWGSAWEDLIERSLGKAREKYLQEVDVAIDAVADLVDAKLQEAKQRVARGRKDVETFVATLDDRVRQFGEAALKSVSTDFDDMGSEIDQHRDALVDKLAQQYKASYDRMSAMEEKLREENKSLWQRIYDATVGLIKKILAFKDMLLNVLAKAASVIGTIIAHPIDFLGNLIDAGKLGFSNFIDHIWEHLKQGFMEWLFGAVAETGIQLPKDFDLPGILSLVLQILGLTYANIRSRAVKILGEKVVKALETAAEIFKILITKGPAGLWEYIKEKIGDLKSMVIEKIKSFVMEKIIMAGVTWLIGLLNPASAFFKACKAIYDIIMFFVEHGKQILDLLNAIIDSITAIAKGAIGAAAAWVEKSLARTIPVIIGFLAALLGVGGISEKIKEIIEAIRKPINEAIDWVINKAVDLVKAVGGLLGFGKKEEPVAKTNDPEHDAKVTAGLAAIDEEDQKRAKDGTVSREDAEQVAVQVKKDHPVFTSITVVAGEGTWDYQYVGSEGRKKGAKAKDGDGDQPPLGSTVNNEGNRKLAIVELGKIQKADDVNPAMEKLEEKTKGTFTRYKEEYKTYIADDSNKKIQWPLTYLRGRSVRKSGKVVEKNWLAEGFPGASPRAFYIAENGSKRQRIPDGVTSNVVADVKDVKYQDFDAQLRDFYAIAKQRTSTGAPLTIYEADGMTEVKKSRSLGLVYRGSTHSEGPTKLSGPLESALDIKRDIITDKVEGDAD